MIKEKHLIFKNAISGVVSLILLISCASVPQQTYMEKSKLSRFNRVAVNVSTAELDVRYSRETGMSTATGASFVLFGLFGFAVAAAEEGGKSSSDKQLAADFKKNTESVRFDDLLCDYFLESLKNANVFKAIAKTAVIDSITHKKLLDDGYDSVIELDIKEMALRKDYGDKLRIHANVWGRLIDLKSGEIVWNRQEVVIGNDAHTIEAFKAGGGKLLNEAGDQVFRKIASRLANDFIYSR